MSARRWYVAPLGAVVVTWILLRSSARAAFGRDSEWKRRSVSPVAGRGLS